MVSAASHRGPDGIHTWSEEGAGIAHLALHVTPEDVRESQPLVEDQVVLAADARIDNRTELRSTLRTHLRTSVPTDADLILASYRRWGTDCARHLIGDFAFAIWDARERRLFAARDPMGMRAFYYRSEADRFLFATEVTQILSAPSVPTRIYEPMVAAYLAGNFNDLDSTFYEGISALPPAHALIVTATELRTRRYWALEPSTRIEYSDERDYVAHFRSLFKEAVRARLRSTHPVGLLLSGGLDSGSVAATAGALREEQGSTLAPLRTYSWAFPSFPQCDERFISDHVATRYGLPATAIDAEASPLLQLDPYVGPDRDEPYVLGFHGVTERALRCARNEGVRCMLSGHRGDLVAGGWIFDYLHFFRTGQWRRLWEEVRLAEQKTGVRWYRAAQHYIQAPLRAAVWPSGRAEGLRAMLKWIYRAVRPVASAPSPFPDWVSPDFAARHQPLPAALSAPGDLHDPMRRRRYEFLLMPAHMRAATLIERNSARHGMVSADPWSDRRLVEFAMAVPPSALCRNGENKWIVREAMRGLMPEPARKNAQKITPHPLHAHALKVQLLPLVRAVCFERQAFDLAEHVPIDRERLMAYYRAYRGGGAEDVRFWYTLTLACWLYQHHADRTLIHNF